MNKEEFILWLETSSFRRERSTNDDYWEKLVDYADYTFDYVEIDEGMVIFKYEEKHWGYTSNETQKYSFEDFIISYNNNSLK